jgi:hypothetical protein
MTGGAMKSNLTTRLALANRWREIRILWSWSLDKLRITGRSWRWRRWSCGRISWPGFEWESRVIYEAFNQYYFLQILYELNPSFYFRFDALTIDRLLKLTFKDYKFLKIPIRNVTHLLLSPKPKADLTPNTSFIKSRHQHTFAFRFLSLKKKSNQNEKLNQIKRSQTQSFEV